MTTALRIRRWWLGLAAAFVLTAAPSAVAGQSAYVPLDDVAYVYIDALIARGELRELSALDRPYSVDAIRRALGAQRMPSRAERAARRRALLRGPLGPGDRRNRELSDALLSAISKYTFSRQSPGGFRAEASASLWATGETSGRRELMLADDNEPHVFAGGAARLLMAGGPLVAFARPILENRLNTDPEFTGRKDRKVAGRVEDAYVRGQWRYAELFFGRAARNWGPYAQQGLMLSDAPYTYDHVQARIGVPRFNAELVLARLENHPDPSGIETQRYFAAHRLNARWRNLEASLGEAVVYSGRGRGFELSFANPLNIYALSWRNREAEANLLVDAQIAARTALGIFSGELMLDDIQIDRCDSVCEEPSSYGVTLSAEGVPFLAGQRLFASYTRVTSLAYRTPNSSERYSTFNVSLGRGYSDYDEVRAGLDVVLAATPLRPYFAYRRQGSGDYRDPFPPESQYASHPVTFVEPVTRVTRFGVEGGRVFGPFDVRGDVGYNLLSAPLTEITPPDGFEGRVRVSFNPRWARLRLAP